MTVNQGGTLLTWVVIHSQLSHVTSLQWKVRVWWVLSNISAFCIFICVSEVNFTNNSTMQKAQCKNVPKLLLVLCLQTSHDLWGEQKRCA